MTGLFTAPTERPLQVMARLPPQLHVSDRISAWAHIHLGDNDRPHSFLEGPAPDGTGGLYAVDVAWGRILHVKGDGDVTVLVEYDGQPAGLARLGDDGLLVADYARGLLVVEDIGSGNPAVRPLLERPGGEGFLGVNDVVVAMDGRVLFTDQGASGIQRPVGRLLCLHPDGRIDTILDGIPSPNGLALDEQTQTVYLAVTRDNSIWRVPMRSTGAWKVGRFIQLSGGVGPDGLAWGPNGSLLVAHLGIGVVWMFDSTGRPRDAYVSPEGPSVTNVAVHQDRLYVTEASSGCVLTGDLPDRQETR